MPRSIQARFRDPMALRDRRAFLRSVIPQQMYHGSLFRCGIGGLVSIRREDRLGLEQE